jgi:hypothetical protein
MVEAVSTVHMRASLSAGDTVTFIPPELQAAIDMSAFDKLADFCTGYLDLYPVLVVLRCVCVSKTHSLTALTHTS